ncbi:MAG: zf-HC2 domain-containing protein [Candidatus Omnitrophica bacterium]|nr:zf-HC2 domain-containing protein [Candidatus Omnitrophota bacterium]
MDCESVRKIIPAYINHNASDNEIQQVEEHLCICQGCREYLSYFIDKKEEEKLLSSPPSQKYSSKSGWDIFTYVIIYLGIILTLVIVFLFIFKK